MLQDHVGTIILGGVEVGEGYGLQKTLEQARPHEGSRLVGRVVGKGRPNSLQQLVSVQCPTVFEGV